MKILFTTICAIFLGFIAFGQASKKVVIFKKTKAIVTDLNNDSQPDTITLYSSSDNSYLNKKIDIQINGAKRKTFFAKYGWENVDKNFLKKNSNSINSNKLFIGKIKGQSIILLFGSLDGAGYRSDFSIISIIDNQPRLIFSLNAKSPDIEIPISLSDINNDGRIEFIFRNIFEYYKPVDSLKADIATYSPYLVYNIGDDFTLNKPLTKKYNEVHYVFAGYEYNEKIKVLVPRNGGKPKIVK